MPLTVEPQTQIVPYTTADTDSTLYNRRHRWYPTYTTADTDGTLYNASGLARTEIPSLESINGDLISTEVSLTRESCEIYLEAEANAEFRCIVRTQEAMPRIEAEANAEFRCIVRRLTTKVSIAPFFVLYISRSMTCALA